jgi:hypothetical protein
MPNKEGKLIDGRRLAQIFLSAILIGIIIYLYIAYKDGKFPHQQVGYYDNPDSVMELLGVRRSPDSIEERINFLIVLVNRQKEVIQPYLSNNQQGVSSFRLNVKDGLEKSNYASALDRSIINTIIDLIIEDAGFD